MKCADGFFKIFSLPVRRILQKADLNFAELQEIRMRINSPLMIRQRGKEYKLTEEGKLLRCNGNEQYEKENIHYVDRCELMETMEYIAGYSLYAYEDELRQGFLTIQGGHRVGVAGKILMEEGKVRSIRYISFLNIRLAHQVEGCADKVMPFIVENGEVKGVETNIGAIYKVKAVVIATGTYLKGKIYIGEKCGTQKED